MALNERILPTEEGGDIARALNKWTLQKLKILQFFGNIAS